MSTEAADLRFDGLLTYFKENRGFDFTGDKLATLERRFRRRMQGVKAEGFAECVDCLEAHPQALAFLAATNRRITPALRLDDAGAQQGVVLVMEEASA